jgi:hypothetical protein
MNSDVRERLRRLGVHKGADKLKSLKPSAEAEVAAARASSSRLNGTQPQTHDAVLEPIRTALGFAYARRAEYQLAHQHGDWPLATAFAHAPDLLARMATATQRGAAIDLRDALFLDTETTGLAGGAGTFAFLVGLGYFHDGSFVIEQFFLHDPGYEAAMLCEIDKRVNGHSALVTFNGQAFDVPLLESRFIVSRIAPSFGDKVHLDLLLPARRMWRGSLDSCSLGSLEYHLLGVQREQRDVPGSVIPYLYREYLSQGGGDLNDDMQRVMYHNLHDILSMVTLVTRLAHAIAQPRGAAEHVAMARFHERAGEYITAERGYRAALETQLEIGDRRLTSNLRSPISNPHSDALRRLARMLKRQGRLAEALSYWQQLCDVDDAEALIEAAKYYEWREVDLPRALISAQSALRLSSDPAARAAINHRIERLERKLNHDHSRSHERSASQYVDGSK